LDIRERKEFPSGFEAIAPQNRRGARLSLTEAAPPDKRHVSA
jgi:hypothetical protein